MDKRPLIHVGEYNMIQINNDWFKGRIFLDQRADMAQFQSDIIEKFIDSFVIQTGDNICIDLDFNIIITGDIDCSEYTVDVFAFANNIPMDDQEFFGNAFSAIHWAIQIIATTIVELGDEIIFYVNMGKVAKAVDSIFEEREEREIDEGEDEEYED